MASYNLYFGDPKGELLLNKKNRSCSPETAVGCDAFDLLKLGFEHDPFRNTFWTGEALVALGSQIEQILHLKRDRVIEDIKKKLHQDKLEPCADHMIAESLSKDKEAVFLQSLRDLFVAAQTHDGTIVYWCD